MKCWRRVEEPNSFPLANDPRTSAQSYCQLPQCILNAVEMCVSVCVSVVSWRSLDFICNKKKPFSYAVTIKDDQIRAVLDYLVLPKKPRYSPICDHCCAHQHLNLRMRSSLRASGHDGFSYESQQSLHCSSSTASVGFVVWGETFANLCLILTKTELEIVPAFSNKSFQT